ncbi:DEAD/DEAH box helicase [Bradyrhizobium genosp. L]|uniref:DEAD/DEAH box helicase n=1 Tax=Bradyrhizobium genosp. L TaxID=83637 RepID=UPI0018A2BE1C|nr:DEAD/DEAH box helicase [Bradyrhizobium genosp. L]QPF87008.1 DEAD/DEAH box helicase [Bradyrhizobium genosp. L]
MISELRPYQLEAMAAIRDSLRGGVRRLMVQAATGAGKTKLAAAMVDSALSRGNRMAFVVPAISLVDQTVESFWAEGIRDVGVIQAQHAMEDWSKPIQVCSIQTIQSRGVFPQASAVIFDEAHRLHEAHKRWIEHPEWRNVPIIGLSATPWARGLGKYFDSLLIAATTSDLIAQGYLSPFRVFATGHPDLSGVKTVAGDYHEGQLSDAMQDGELTADIIKTWKEKWGQAKTLCFAVDKAHARSIQERFEHAGVACGYQDAQTTSDERTDIKRKFHNGEYPVVVNIQTLTIGVDWDVRCLILARPTRSAMLFVQIIGRALRTAPGKDYALILDHSDTTQRLGFVTDIHRDRLDDGSSESKKLDATQAKKPLPKECKQCGCLKAARICPNCGTEPKRLASGPIENEGELIEIAPGQSAPKQKRGAWSEVERQKFFAEMKAYAQTKGFKPGWAAIKFKERYKEFPPRSFDRIPPAAEVSPVVSSWIRSRNIAFAKSKRRASLMVADAQ